MTKYVSIAIQRKQSFRFSFSYVCTYCWCGAVFDILKVTFRKKTARSKNKQQKIFKKQRKVSNQLRNRLVRIPVTITMASESVKCVKQLCKDVVRQMNEECSIQTEDTKVLNVPEEAELDEGSYNGEDSRDALVELYKKENEKLKDQLALMKKDLEEVHSENESFQTEVEALRLELKRRNSNEEYRERAFTNLRKAIKKKDKLLKSLEDELNYTQMDKNYYLYHIELLEDKLKETEEKNDDLQFECDDLREMVKELKKIKEDENNFAQMDKNYYLHQIELLEHELKESKESNEVLQFECDELRETFKELKEMKEAEGNFAQMDKNYYLYQIELLENKLKESKESNEVLQFECDEMRETFEEFKEIKQDENNFAQMNKNYYLYQIELLEDKLKESKESNENFPLVCALISNHPIFLVFKSAKLDTILVAVILRT